MTEGSLPLATVDEAHASLHVIACEVAAELNGARVALEAYAERPADRGALHRFSSHIHLARGALRLAEVYGGALLAEEMEHVARHVDEQSTGAPPDPDALDALVRAMEQLPSYVERVATGARDVPLGLLPLLNDLRAVRGAALVSEGTLLLLDLKSDAQPRPAAVDREVADVARRLRPRFQLALLGWIRGEQPAEQLGLLAEIAAQVEGAATTQPVYQLWWVVGAVVEALREGAIEGNVSVKRVLGHVDRELKRLQDLGERAYVDEPPVEILHNLLYFVAQGPEAGPRVREVRQSFGLQDVVAAQEGDGIESTETLSTPSVRLMRTVGAAIREDLTHVKDVLDIFVRQGATQVDDLAPQLDLLRKISDTLGVLGLGALRSRVDGELESLRAIVERRIEPDETALLGIAAALIAVEDSLDTQLVRLILPDARGVEGAPGEPTDEEFRAVQVAVLRECIVNMARIKEAVTHSLSAPAEAQGLDQVPQLVRGITAGLLMLGKQRAVDIMEGVGRALGRIVRPDEGSLTPARLERLADAVVAVEYYMETLQAGRADQWQMLDAAEARLAEIEPLATARVLSWREGRAAEETPSGRTQPVLRALAEPAPPETAESSPPAPAPAQAAPAYTTADPEFVELFVEEARENVARIAGLLPQWEQNPDDAEALRELRRAFHTLKGSGRMVGAQRVGEFSWSVESLLNRVISQTLPRSPAVVEVVRDAVAAMPALVDEIGSGAVAQIDVAAIMARADALSGREGPALPEAAVPAPSPPAAAQRVQPAAPPRADEPGMDPVLRDIFRKETAGHILVVRQFLERCTRSVPPHPVTEALYRACHTLSGISKTAGARQGIKVAEPMERYVRKLFDNGHGLETEALALLRDTVRLLETVAEHVDEATGFFPEQGRLIAGWSALERALDAELARLAEAAERTLGTAWQPATEPEPAPRTGSAEDLTEPSLPCLTEELLMRGGQDLAPVTPPAPVEPRREFEGFPPGEPRAPLHDEEFDADIAAIFGEEATELLEQADHAFARWRGDRADRAHITELKRLLHTLKGGSRMAGLRAMGDLSHEVESFLAAIGGGDVVAGDSAFEVLQASLDELHRMREQANSGVRIVPARDLITRIRAVGQAQATRQAQGAEPPVPVVVTEPPVESPVEFPVPPPEPVTAEPATEPGDAIVGTYPVTLAWPTPPAAPVVDIGIEPGPAPAIAGPEPEPDSGPAVPAGLAARDTPTQEAEAAVLPPAPSEPAAEREIEPSVPTVGSTAQPVLPGREPAPPPERAELARVDAELLDDLLNNAGEVSIFRARIEQQMTSIEFNLAELDRTVTRLRDQLRKMELETEAQILHKHQRDVDAAHRADFDPLELDRYSAIQQLSRALAESVSDVASIEGLLANLSRETQNLLQQQGRVVTEVQNGLMRTRMVPIQRHVQRLTRVVRQAATEAGKKAELVVEGASGELDRQVLERMLPPFEHMLRNAVVHGLEAPAARLAAGKPETGRITLRLQREGAEVVIVVEDDGAGLDVAGIRAKARHVGLLQPGQDLTDEQALQLVLEAGFTTASLLTQSAGRGVGMDVVATEVKKLGGGLFIESQPGHGARFTIRLPFTLAITQALIVRVHDELYALPMATVEGVARLPRPGIEQHLGEEAPTFEYGGQRYHFQHLGTFVGSGPSVLPETDAALPVVLVRAGEHSTALVTDELVGNREIVVKPVGPQIAGIRGISGATILGDGRIVVILDAGTLVRSEWRAKDVRPAQAVRDDRIFAVVVDDSITVRRVTQRLLERNGMRVMTAKDGVEAMALLQEHVPDVILLDIEMPRMDGYEVAAQVRSDERLAEVPIIMITSRVGDKHRARAIELGVDDYLGKPYQESQLLDAIEPLVLARRRMQQQ